MTKSEIVSALSTMSDRYGYPYLVGLLDFAKCRGIKDVPVAVARKYYLIIQRALDCSSQFEQLYLKLLEHSEMTPKE